MGAPMGAAPAGSSMRLSAAAAERARISLVFGDPGGVLLLVGAFTSAGPLSGGTTAWAPCTLPSSLAVGRVVGGAPAGAPVIVCASVCASVGPG